MGYISSRVARTSILVIQQQVSSCATKILGDHMSGILFRIFFVIIIIDPVNESKKSFLIIDKMFQYGMLINKTFKQTSSNMLAYRAKSIFLICNSIYGKFDFHLHTRCDLSGFCCKGEYFTSPEFAGPFSINTFMLHRNQCSICI